MVGVKAPNRSSRDAAWQRKASCREKGTVASESPRPWVCSRTKTSISMPRFRPGCSRQPRSVSAPRHRAP